MKLKSKKVSEIMFNLHRYNHFYKVCKSQFYLSVTHNAIEILGFIKIDQRKTIYNIAS